MKTVTIKGVTWFRASHPLQCVLALAVLLSALSGAAFARVEVSASIDTTSGYVGDPIGYEFLVHYGEGDSVVVPPQGINLAAFRILDYVPVIVASDDVGNRVTGGSYRLTAFRPGTYVIPPLPIRYFTADGSSGELVTPALSVEIISMGVTLTDSLRDIKPPVSIPLSLRRWVRIVLIVVGSLVVGLVALLIWLRRRVPDGEKAATEYIVVDELAEFDKIPARELIESGNITALYVEVSERMRSYISRRYGIAALEMTHAELVVAFDDQYIDQGETALIMIFLARCDLVKFAKFMPEESEIESLVERAKDVVRRTQMDTIPLAAESPTVFTPTDIQTEDVS
jgi:hypothetical protein